MKKTVLLGLAVSAMAFHSTASAQNNALGVSLGTSGLGFEVTRPFTDTVRGRFKVGIFDFNVDREIGDIEYEANLKNNTVGLVLDWHPFAGRFHLSMGVMNTAMEVDLKSQVKAGTYNIGGNKYTVQDGDLRLKGAAEFAPVSPYFGLGWNTKISNTGLNFTAEIGVLLVGNPKVSVDASGKAQNETTGLVIENVERNPEFQEKLEEERRELEKDLEDFKIWPGVNIGVAYQF